jgi:hypothetical protein
MWRIAELAQLMAADLRIADAVTQAQAQRAAGTITDRQYQDWMDHLAEPVILCPYCGDWEEIGDVTIRGGRFYCCDMCALSPDRADGTAAAP